MFRDRRGSVMLEFVAACLVLVVIFTGITETADCVKTGLMSWGTAVHKPSFLQKHKKGEPYATLNLSIIP